MSNSPRPTFFISRGNGVLTPLIAVDELPSFLKIVGVPASMSLAETTNMQSLGEKAHGGEYYAVQLTGSSPLNAVEHLSQKPTGSQRNISPPKRFRSPDADVLAEKVGVSGAKDIENWRQGVMTAENAQAVIDEVVAANEKQVAAIHKSNPSTPRAAPQSRTQAAASPGVYGKKVYCTYWLKTGNCHYQQQGCLYKHEMPDNKTLNDIGIGRRPDWHVKKFGYDWKPEKEKAAPSKQPWRVSSDQQARPAPLPTMNGFGRTDAGYGQAYAGPMSPGFLPLTDPQPKNPVSLSPGLNGINYAAQRSPPKGFMPFSSGPTYSPTTFIVPSAGAATPAPTKPENYMAPANTATTVPTASTPPANTGKLYIASRAAIAKPATAAAQQPVPPTSEPSKLYVPSPQLTINTASKAVRPIDTIKSLAPSSPSVSPMTKASASASAAPMAGSDSAAAPSLTITANTQKANCFQPPSPNPMHRRYFVAPGESSFVQNTKEKPRVVQDGWMAREKKAKQEAATAIDANVPPSSKANGNPTAKSNTNAYGNGNGNANKGKPAVKTSAKNPPGKNPLHLKKNVPKSKNPKGKAGVKGRGGIGAQVLDKETAMVEDLLLDIEE